MNINIYQKCSCKYIKIISKYIKIIRKYEKIVSKYLNLLEFQIPAFRAFCKTGSMYSEKCTCTITQNIKKIILLKVQITAPYFS